MLLEENQLVSVESVDSLARIEQMGLPELQCFFNKACRGQLRLEDVVAWGMIQQDCCSAKTKVASRNLKGFRLCGQR